MEYKEGLCPECGKIILDEEKMLCPDCLSSSFEDNNEEMEEIKEEQEQRFAESIELTE